jgi:hypothetical protein
MAYAFGFPLRQKDCSLRRVVSRMKSNLGEEGASLNAESGDE